MPENLALTPEDIANTCYRAWSHAWGGAVPAWETLALEVQVPFLRLARRAESALERLQGQSFSRVTEELMRLAFGEHEPSRTPRDLIAWEAVARHLVALIDSDELDSPEALGDLEGSWAPWGELRRSKVIERTEGEL